MEDKEEQAGEAPVETSANPGAEKPEAEQTSEETGTEEGAGAEGEEESSGE